MPIVINTPGVDELGRVLDVLPGWSGDTAAGQLHPGDLGWFWRFGAPATAAAVRVWTDRGRIVAVGLHDGPGLLRLAIDPDVQDEPEPAAAVAADLDRVLTTTTLVEAAPGARLRAVLAARGWVDDEAWTPLRRDLTEPVDEPGLRIEVVAPGRESVRTRTHRAAFRGSTFTDARWSAMAAGPPYRRARCLVGHDDRGRAVAAVTVWSAGSGRPGLVEPMGVPAEHRGHGHGRAISLAAAAALRELGSSIAVVAAPAANTGAIATYCGAGFRPGPEVRDLRRPPGQ